ncbi:hypothetical protein Trco_000990, partial [Trichoderma cornu-damae]
ASLQSPYDVGSGPDSVRASPSRVLPGQEPYYSNRGRVLWCSIIFARALTTTDIAVLHAVITAAQEQLDHATGPKPLPAAALFRAYDEILPQHGVDPDSDHHLSALVFRVGGEQGGGSLLDKFQSILGRIGIVLEFSDDSVTSPQGYPEHPLSPEPVDTSRWYPDDLPNKEDDAPFRVRPRTCSPIPLEDDPEPELQKIQTQEPSLKKGFPAKDDLAHAEVEAYPSAQISTTATRHLDQYHQYPSPLFDHLPVDFRIVSAGTPDGDFKLRLLAPQTDTSQHSSRHKSERNTLAVEIDRLPEPMDGQDQRQASDVGDDKKPNQTAIAPGKRNTPTEMSGGDPDEGGTDGAAIPKLPHHTPKDDGPISHSIRGDTPLAFLSNNETTLSRQQQEQLLTRATRAREIYLASKVFNHWADRTAARLEREGVARRHMIRFRCFQGWSCAPSLRFPVIHHLKALTAVQKLQRAVSYQEEQLCLAASAISQSYRVKMASRVYDQWCSHLITLACRRRANKRLKQSALLAWKSSAASNTIKSQAIHKFNTREGIVGALSKLEEQALLNSRQFHAARQIGSLQLLFGYLNEWRDQIPVKARASAYCASLSTANASRAFQNWNLLVRVQAFRWRADYISVTRALESWRRRYIQEDLRRNMCMNHLKSYHISNFLYALQRSGGIDAHLSHLSSRARLFIVTTQTLPIMDTAVEIRRSQMKIMIRRYLMMRYTQVSSARKRRKFYEAFDHWRTMTARTSSESDVAAAYQTKYYHGQLDTALTKWKRQTGEDLQVQLATYKHYAQALLTTWGDFATEHNRMDMQALELWAARRQRQHLKAWSISSLQRSGQAHTATRVQQKNYGEKRNRTFQHWRQACTSFDGRSDQDLRFSPKSELPSGRRSGWRALSVRRHLLMERHNRQDIAARQIETPTRWTGTPLNMSFPILTKPIVPWRGTDEDSTTSSDTEDAGMLKSPSKAPANIGRGTLPSTTPRGPVPMHLNMKTMRTETSPRRWSKGDVTLKSRPDKADTKI